MFNSVFAREMDAYIELRTAVVSEITSAHDRRVLSLLDKYLVEISHQEKCLPENVLSEWSKTLSGKSKTIKEKLGVARGFGKYLNTLGYHSFLPTLPKVKSSYIPYIFSDLEIDRIFHYADNLTPVKPGSSSAFFTLEVPMVLRILYSCGTRLGETMSLQRKDVDFKNRTIFLRKTKFSKERTIPAHESLIGILERYCLALGILHQPEAFLFPGKKEGTHYTARQMQFWFSKILEAANIDQGDRKSNERGASLHCFRHLFVLKSMQQLEAAGRSVDMNDLLLPSYLGHECLLDTDQYMRFSGVQVTESLDAFESFTAGLIPAVEVPYEED